MASSFTRLTLLAVGVLLAVRPSAGLMGRDVTQDAKPWLYPVIFQGSFLDLPWFLSFSFSIFSEKQAANPAVAGNLAGCCYRTWYHFDVTGTQLTMVEPGYTIAGLSKAEGEIDMDAS